MLAGVSSLALLAPWARMQSAPQAQQKVDTPMATDERLEAPGWWPTKRSASREDYVGTAEVRLPLVPQAERPEQRGLIPRD